MPDLRLDALTRSELDELQDLLVWWIEKRQKGAPSQLLEITALKSFAERVEEMRLSAPIETTR